MTKGDLTLTPKNTSSQGEGGCVGVRFLHPSHNSAPEMNGQGQYIMDLQETLRHTTIRMAGQEETHLTCVLP